MATHAQPIIRALQGEMEDVLAGFQFDDREPAGTRDAEKVQDAVFTTGVGENLRVNEARIERRVRFSCSDHRCSKGFSPEPRTSQQIPHNEATRPPFSRSSMAPEATNSRRRACSSEENSMSGIIDDLYISEIIFLYLNCTPVTFTAGCCMFQEAGTCSKETSN